MEHGSIMYGGDKKVNNVDKQCIFCDSFYLVKYRSAKMKEIIF